MTKKLLDISQKLNLSLSTVSRALNNNSRISEDTKKLVLQAAEEIGYTPNFIAKGLADKKTYNIGLIIPHIRGTFYSEILHGVESQLDGKKYNMLISTSSNSEGKELESIKMLASKQVDGILISMSSQTKDLKLLSFCQNQNIPVVMFDRVIEDIDLPKIRVDTNDAYNKIISHLVEVGARDIVHIVGLEKGIIENQRQKSLKSTLDYYNIDNSPNKFINSGFDEDGGIQAFKEILKGKTLPDVITTSTSLQAIGIIQYAKQQGISIPHDIKLTGFYTTPFTELIFPRLTGVSFSIPDMGRLAINTLIDKIETKDKENKDIILPTELLIRESTTIINPK